MSLRTRALAAGLAVVVLYLAGAAWSGSLSPADRRPLLDGFAPPPSYHWVSPPPGLAGSNQPAEGVTLGLKLSERGSRGGFFSTPDAQFSLILGIGAFVRQPGQTSVQVTIEPLAPSSVGTAPSGLTIVGNVYRVRARYEPGGVEARLVKPQTVQMLYPAEASSGLTVPRHTVALSTDGRAWTRLDTRDSVASQQASAPVKELGYFAVARSGSRGGVSLMVILGVLAAGLAILAVLAVASGAVGPLKRKPDASGGGPPRR